MQTSPDTNSLPRTILNRWRGRKTALVALIAVAALIAVSAFSFIALANKKRARKATAKAVASAKTKTNDRASSSRERREKAEKGRRGEIASREGAEPERERYEALLEQEAYWAARVTYPTGNFDPAWVRQALEQDKEIERAIPAGRSQISSR